MSLVAVAQSNVNGMFSYVIGLSDGEYFDVSAVCAKNPYASLEAELAACTANQVLTNVQLRSIVGDCLNSSLEGKLGGLIVNMKTDAAPLLFVEKDSAYSVFYHKLVSNATFRMFLQERILVLLKETCRMYPSSYRELLLNKIDEAVLLISDMQRQHYQIINDKLYKNNILQADGRTLECWIVRRVLVDGISVGEMKNFLKSARKLVGETFNPEKPAFVSSYVINNQLQCNIRTNGSSLYFLDKKSKTIIEGVLSIQCLKDASGIYYQIRTARRDKSGKRVEESTLYDSMGKVVH